MFCVVYKAWEWVKQFGKINALSVITETWAGCWGGHLGCIYIGCNGGGGMGVIMDVI
jgi:hypothetical protein